MSTPAASATPARPAAGSAGTPRKGRGKPRVISGFTQEDMVIRRPKTVEEKVKYRRKREERTAIQQSVDALVLNAYKEWLAVGKPRKFVDVPLVIWEIRKNKEEDARFMLGKAAALIQRQLRFGDCPEANGKVELAFYVLDRAVKVAGAPDEEAQDAPSE